MSGPDVGHSNILGEMANPKVIRNLTGVKRFDADPVTDIELHDIVLAGLQKAAVFNASECKAMAVGLIEATVDGSILADHRKLVAGFYMLHILAGAAKVLNHFSSALSKLSMNVQAQVKIALENEKPVNVPAAPKAAAQAPAAVVPSDNTITHYMGKRRATRNDPAPKQMTVFNFQVAPYHLENADAMSQRISCSKRFRDEFQVYAWEELDIFRAAAGAKHLGISTYEEYVKQNPFELYYAYWNSKGLEVLFIMRTDIEKARDNGTRTSYSEREKVSGIPPPIGKAVAIPVPVPVPAVVKPVASVQKEQRSKVAFTEVKGRRRNHVPEPAAVVAPTAESTYASVLKGISKKSPLKKQGDKEFYEVRANTPVAYGWVLKTAVERRIRENARNVVPTEKTVDGWKPTGAMPGYRTMAEGLLLERMLKTSLGFGAYKRFYRDHFDLSKPETWIFSDERIAWNEVASDTVRVYLERHNWSECLPLYLVGAISGFAWRIPDYKNFAGCILLNIYPVEHNSEVEAFIRLLTHPDQKEFQVLSSWFLLLAQSLPLPKRQGQGKSGGSGPAKGPAVSKLSNGKISVNMETERPNYGRFLTKATFAKKGQSGVQNKAPRKPAASVKGKEPVRDDQLQGKSFGLQGPSAKRSIDGDRKQYGMKKSERDEYTCDQCGLNPDECQCDCESCGQKPSLCECGMPVEEDDRMDVDIVGKTLAIDRSRERIDAEMQYISPDGVLTARFCIRHKGIYRDALVNMSSCVNEVAWRVFADVLNFREDSILIDARYTDSVDTPNLFRPEDSFIAKSAVNVVYNVLVFDNSTSRFMSIPTFRVGSVLGLYPAHTISTEGCPWIFHKYMSRSDYHVIPAVCTASPSGKSQLNGVNGEATNSDDVNHHVVKSQLNGINGEVTNSDDVSDMDEGTESFDLGGSYAAAAYDPIDVILKKTGQARIGRQRDVDSIDAMLTFIIDGKTPQDRAGQVMLRINDTFLLPVNSSVTADGTNTVVNTCLSTRIGSDANPIFDLILPRTLYTYCINSSGAEVMMSQTLEDLKKGYTQENSSATKDHGMIMSSGFDKRSVLQVALSAVDKRLNLTEYCLKLILQMYSTHLAGCDDSELPRAQLNTRWNSNLAPYCDQDLYLIIEDDEWKSRNTWCEFTVVREGRNPLLTYMPYFSPLSGNNVLGFDQNAHHGDMGTITFVYHTSKAPEGSEIVFISAEVARSGQKAIAMDVMGWAPYPYGKSNSARYADKAGNYSSYVSSLDSTFLPGAKNIAVILPRLLTDDNRGVNWPSFGPNVCAVYDASTDSYSLTSQLDIEPNVTYGLSSFCESWATVTKTDLSWFFTRKSHSFEMSAPVEAACYMIKHSVLAPSLAIATANTRQFRDPEIPIDGYLQGVLENTTWWGHRAEFLSCINVQVPETTTALLIDRSSMRAANLVVVQPEIAGSYNPPRFLTQDKLFIGPICDAFVHRCAMDLVRLYGYIPPYYTSIGMKDKHRWYAFKDRGMTWGNTLSGNRCRWIKSFEAAIGYFCGMKPANRIPGARTPFEDVLSTDHLPYPVAFEAQRRDDKVIKHRWMTGCTVPNLLLAYVGRIPDIYRPIKQLAVWEQRTRFLRTKDTVINPPYDVMAIETCVAPYVLSDKLKLEPLDGERPFHGQKEYWYNRNIALQTRNFSTLRKQDGSIVDSDDGHRQALVYAYRSTVTSDTVGIAEWFSGEFRNAQMLVTQATPYWIGSDKAGWTFVTYGSKMRPMLINSVRLDAYSYQWDGPVILSDDGRDIEQHKFVDSFLLPESGSKGPDSA